MRIGTLDITLDDCPVERPVEQGERKSKKTARRGKNKNEPDDDDGDDDDGNTKRSRGKTSNATTPAKH